MDTRSQLLKGITDTLLLTLIERQPMYGYQIIKDISRRSGGYFRFNQGTLYPALHRLEQRGLVAAHWGRSPSGQERRYYAITEKGRQALREKSQEWQGFALAMSMVVGDL